MFKYEDLSFRPVEEKDIESIRKIRNDETTWKCLTYAEMINPLNQIDWYIKMSKDPLMQYFVVEQETSNFPVQSKEIIGFIRMDCIDKENRSRRVGFDVEPSKRGQGYGTRIMLAIQKYCFNNLGVNRLWLCVVEDNEIAKKLYENTGFKEEGRYRKAIWRDGKYKDYIIMSILESEYREQHAFRK